MQWLLQALAARPEDAELRALAVSALQACAAGDEAIALMWEHVERHTDSEQALAYELLGALLGRGDHDRVERLIALYADTDMEFSSDTGPIEEDWGWVIVR